MAKVITFSRTFPAYHPKAGKETNFVEKFWESYQLSETVIDKALTPLIPYIQEYKSSNDWTYRRYGAKNHTIRVGNRWKEGEYFSPRVWSGKPYRSKMIKIAPDTQIKKIWNIEMDIEGTFYINGKYVDVTSSIHDGKTVADNDGLDSDDLLNWFPVGKPFKGQIICWNENINY